MLRFQKAAQRSLETKKLRRRGKRLSTSFLLGLVPLNSQATTGTSWSDGCSDDCSVLEEGRLWNVGEERERSTGAAGSSFSSSSSCCSPLYLPTLGSSTNSCDLSLSSELGFEIRKFLRSSLQVLFEEGACTITLLLFVLELRVVQGGGGPQVGGEGLRLL